MSTDVPFIFTLDEMVEWLLESGQWPTVAELGTALHRLGRNSGPALLYDV